MTAIAWIIPGLTIAAGLFGIVLGSVLRPVVEDWFARQRKTLHVVLQPSSEFKAPHKSVQFSWEGNSLSRLIQTGFSIENRTRHTLRNFRVEVSSPEPKNADDVCSTYVAADGSARFEVNESGNLIILNVDFLEPSAKLKGALLSNYTDQVHFASLDDIELRRTTPFDTGGMVRFLAGMASAGGLVAIATGALAIATGI